MVTSAIAEKDYNAIATILNQLVLRRRQTFPMPVDPSDFERLLFSRKAQAHLDAFRLAAYSQPHGFPAAKDLHLRASNAVRLQVPLVGAGYEGSIPIDLQCIQEIIVPRGGYISVFPGSPLYKDVLQWALAMNNAALEEHRYSRYVQMLFNVQHIYADVVNNPKWANLTTFNQVRGANPDLMAALGGSTTTDWRHKQTVNKVAALVREWGSGKVSCRLPSKVKDSGVLSDNPMVSRMLAMGAVLPEALTLPAPWAGTWITNPWTPPKG